MNKIELAKFNKFRKAQAEGGQLQYFVDSFVGWQNVEDFNQQIKTPESFRIKPKKFKTGDWVVVNDIITQWDDFLKRHQDKAECKLWVPKKGDTCIFWNNNQKTFTISEYYEKEHNGYTEQINFKNYSDIAPLEYIEIIKRNLNVK